MVAMPQTESKTAAYWLDRACYYETDGKDKSASMSLNAAIRADDDEHAADPATATLPRKAV